MRSCISAGSVVIMLAMVGLCSCNGNNEPNKSVEKTAEKAGEVNRIAEPTSNEESKEPNDVDEPEDEVADALAKAFDSTYTVDEDEMAEMLLEVLREEFEVILAAPDELQQMLGPIEVLTRSDSPVVKYNALQVNKAIFEANTQLLIVSMDALQDVRSAMSKVENVLLDRALNFYNPIHQKFLEAMTEVSILQSKVDFEEQEYPHELSAITGDDISGKLGYSMEDYWSEKELSIQLLKACFDFHDKHKDLYETARANMVPERNLIKPKVDNKLQIMCLYDIASKSHEFFLYSELYYVDTADLVQCYPDLAEPLLLALKLENMINEISHEKIEKAKRR